MKIEVEARGTSHASGGGHRVAFTVTTSVHENAPSGLRALVSDAVGAAVAGFFAALAIGGRFDMDDDAAVRAYDSAGEALWSGRLADWAIITEGKGAADGR